ncbi:4-hydroxy-3-methylbut-2-enyl diphosphate reductase [Desulfurobacterium pacificum]|uniref:4-hydroxy-3-methylbut-2-enyl diphosphate reductase n=1 Tax=Desulfurobacterium pacificum TaxID=240166 RepID=A0ABY1NLQ0_9BACT|nr:4-hydroxy-3-methylbut-2-enyl diphosphate reductase [Desulfurobacterium pacificum]SMP11928.1 4-hydroxy-3-methylbut-2-enyl diphosphate reductase [Desulfurobacterium pacificum]
MEIVVAKSAGFCWGVKRAVKMAVESLKTSKSGKVFCLGELIHNRLEIERLKSMGMVFVEDFEKIPEGESIIIRSHGVAPSVIENLKKKKLKIVDATCPFVKDVHEKAMKLERENYPVLILGNPNHPEVKGIAGHVKNPLIASTLSEIEKLPSFSRLGVVCQTTLNINFFKEAISTLLLKVKDIKIYNTICNATYIRQKEAKELAKNVDVMLIVGGKNSSNTTKLYQISKTVNENSFHVESEEEIDKDWFKNAKKVGITAGASTPQWVIEKVVNYLLDIAEGGELSGRGIRKTVRREFQPA